ncbi:hypothetical protein LUW74_14135 [Actinomadura madurae]|uniref:hypothetical protein n=1 Tax=Actinomadura madurae TaxID=1993 RepID=UPI002026782F|nr:hypothetical protein [Actinomadura madurae]URN04335.1 hypothetical protein LUW74_14135 [Actinomadura madurae]
MTTPGTPPAGRFGRLAAWSQRHRWAALALWAVVVAVITVGSQAAGTAYHNDFALPGTDSQAAADLMTEHGSREAGATVQIVAENPRASPATARTSTRCWPACAGSRRSPPSAR